jgi:YVTN family beta-propeller protein
VGKIPHALAVSPDGLTIFVTNLESRTVRKIDAKEQRVVGNPVTVQDKPQSVTFSTDGQHAYVVNEGSDSVSVLESASGRVTDTQSVGKSPRNVAVAPDGGLVFVTIGEADKLWVAKVSA